MEVRDKWLNDELFYCLGEARVLIEHWRIHFNTLRPHQSIGKQPPAPGTWHLATQDQNGKGLALEPVSSDPNSARRQATIEFAKKYS